ncbi:sodium:solute symporter [Priestia megaterium]|uniref:sodium:solute symporter family protein n=1 Tax=Priestia megaterium TaxID=1404 RepID=UPI00366F1A5D
MNIALSIIFGFLILAIILGVLSSKGKDMNMEQWSVGGRGFGTALIFLLMAGEIYTTFTFLGGSGWAYGKGGPTFYILAYGCLAYVISYFLLPKIWKYAQEHKLISQSDFFVKRYDSKLLGVLVSIVGVLAIIPYLVLQLKGLSIIVAVTSYNTISSSTAIWIGAIAITIYVTISGIRGSAWTAVLKDSLILIVVLFLGIFLPIHYYDGIQPMFKSIETIKPGFLALPQQGLSISWFISTVLLSSVGFYAWPHIQGAIYSAKHPAVFRKNAIIMPLYQLILLFVFFVGFVAIEQVPGLEKSNVDLALLKISIQTFDPWIVGIIGAAGLLTALVPGSMVLMSASTLITKNIYQTFFPKTSEKKIIAITKLMVPIVALISVYFTFNGGDTLVPLLLMGFSLATQLFPGMFFGILKNNFVTKQGITTGIITGVGIVAYTTITNTTIGTVLPSVPQWIKDINIGIIALVINLLSMAAVSFITTNLQNNRMYKLLKEDLEK